jgi:glutathione S-transferase
MVLRLMRLYEIPFSTNVERVTMALAFKGLEAERVTVDPDDRSPVEEISGQPLVPVLVLDDGEVIADSTAILRRLEADHPDPPLWPSEPSHAAGLEIFAEWFNVVWKRAPNAIADTGGTQADWDALRDHAALFERLLDTTDYLLGDRLTAADLLAYPFLKYAVHIDPADDERFHQVLHEGQSPGPRLRAWIDRISGTAR